MLISKTNFMNYIKCPIYFKLAQASPNMKSNEENVNTKYLEMLSSMIDENISINTKQVEVMMPYYKKVEALAGEAVLKRFGGNITNAADTFEQIKFERTINDNTYLCYLDVYNKTKNCINIIEVKSTTSNKFLSMGAKGCPLFFKDSDNIIKLMEIRKPELLSNKKYTKYRDRLFDLMDGVGKYFYDLAYQSFIINSASQEPCNFYLAVLNHEYIFEGNYDDNNQAVYSADLSGNELITFIDVNPLLSDYHEVIRRDIKDLELIINVKEFQKPYLDKKCSECNFKAACWKGIPDENSILKFIGSHYGFKNYDGEKVDQYELLNNGPYKTIEDIPYEWLTREKNLIQKDCVVKNEIYVDKEKIEVAINELSYPLYHLDFETFPCPLPRFKGEKPYSQSLFQFSLHIEEEPGVCNKEDNHYEFLANSHKDIREEFIVQMLKNIDLDSGGNVIVYNQGFEKTRIKELAAVYPKYEEKLSKLNEMVFDLLYIVRSNEKLFSSLGFKSDRAKLFNYYHPKLNGSFSIKKVLPVFSKLSYKDLEVGNGMDAMLTYANEEVLKQKQVQLKEYCKQDTWAMVEILRSLRELI